MKNTDVEWSRVAVGNSNTITTSHKEGSEAGGPRTLADALLNGATDIVFDHSHPFTEGGTYPSGRYIPYDLTPKGEGDRGVLIDMKKLFPDVNIKSRVYDSYNNDYVLFNENKILGREKE